MGVNWSQIRIRIHSRQYRLRFRIHEYRTDPEYNLKCGVLADAGRGSGAQQNVTRLWRAGGGSGL